ncbi:hypothetical protein DM02DRAFT_621688 [Periconia macrospinosa]|uniref:Uncharacterized protein n=1 Tax=Periconia macrospinosa TaxID=97972 RepID=A0A2V1EFA6_9PLEO|nr:hypothetical protein DM02DRAFT_621688 [Periconia macrospinosa]
MATNNSTESNSKSSKSNPGSSKLIPKLSNPTTKSVTGSSDDDRSKINGTMKDIQSKLDRCNAKIVEFQSKMDRTSKSANTHQTNMELYNVMAAKEKGYMEGFLMENKECQLKKDAYETMAAKLQAQMDDFKRLERSRIDITPSAPLPSTQNTTGASPAPSPTPLTMGDRQILHKKLNHGENLTDDELKEVATFIKDSHGLSSAPPIDVMQNASATLQECRGNATLMDVIRLREFIRDNSGCRKRKREKASERLKRMYKEVFDDFDKQSYELEKERAKKAAKK